MSQAVRIRNAVSEDADVVARLLEELGYPTSPQQVTARIAALAQNPAVLLVAETALGVRGLLALAMVPTVHLDEPVARITALVVREGARGQGIGGELLRSAYAQARGRGAKMVEVTSNNRRTRAHEFYRNAGFIAPDQTRFLRLLGEV